MTVSRSKRIVVVLASLLCLAAMVWFVAGLSGLHASLRQACNREGEHGQVLINNFISRLPEQIPSYPRGVLPANSPAALYAQHLVEKGEIVRLTLLDLNERNVFSVGSAASAVYAPFPPGQTMDGRGFLLEELNSFALAVPVKKHDSMVASVGIVLAASPGISAAGTARKLYLTGIILDIMLLFVLGSVLLTDILGKTRNPLFEIFLPLRNRLLRRAEVADGQALDQGTIGGTSEAVRHFPDWLTTGEEQSGFENLPVMAGIASEPAEKPVTAVISAETEAISKAWLPAARLSVVVADAIHALGQQKDVSRIQLLSSAREDMPDVAIDQDVLHLALLNLMLNACDVMPDGGRLVVRAKEDLFTDNIGRISAFARIDILDSGRGFSSRQQVRIFSPDYRPRAVPRDIVPRLIEARMIVEEAGGSIVLKSRVGKGSCFTVWLPLAG